MNKRLRLPLAVALALGSLPAFALGLGQIEVKSSLNQPLVAEIPVLSVSAGEAESLAVRLASADAFARAGLERPHLLNANLQFEVKRAPSGRTVITVTTPNQVREPFLSFLLEVEWGNGKLLREYTVLLDPPSMAPVRSAPPAPVAATPLREPAPARYEPLEEPSAPPQPAPAPAPVPQAVAPAPAPAPSYTPPSEPLPSYGADNYSVMAGDTLWSIATRSRPDANVSVQQMMLALLRANPEAFIDNNINRLKKGAVLRIPGRDETTVVTAAEAAAEVRGQIESWRGASATAAQPADAPMRTSDAGSRRTSSSTPSSRLELTPPGGEGTAAQSGASSTGEGRELRAELDRSREQVNSLKQENVELKSRVQELESMQGDSRKLIELKDSELAAAQRRLAETEQQLATAKATEEAQAVSVTAAAPVADEPVIPAGPDAVAQQDQAEAMASPETDAATGEGEMATPAEPVSEPVALSDTPPAPVQSAEEPKPAPVTAAAPAEETGGGLPFNPWIVGGGALALVSLIALLLSRRRSGKNATTKPSGKAASGAPSIAAAFEQDSGAGMQDSQSAEQDEQIEGELVEALAQYPNDLALHLDLLRHYYDHGDAAAFESAAEGMYAQVYDSKDPNWLQAVELGRVIAPDHPLFVDLDASGPVTTPQPAVALQDDVEWDASTYEEAEQEPVASTSSRMFEDVTSVRPAIPEEDFGADSDAASTKLELARAYLDMGDSEGARGMLEEVLGEGSAAQREEARRLLADMH